MFECLDILKYNILHLMLFASSIHYLEIWYFAIFKCVRSSLNSVYISNKLFCKLMKISRLLYFYYLSLLFVFLTMPGSLKISVVIYELQLCFQSLVHYSPPFLTPYNITWAELVNEYGSIRHNTVIWKVIGADSITIGQHFFFFFLKKI
jgi:hypothetical protein